MLMNYIFCGNHPFNQHVWILHTYRDREREKLRGTERCREGGRQRKSYIYIDRMRGKPIPQPVCSQWQDRGESRLREYETTVKTLYWFPNEMNAAIGKPLQIFIETVDGVYILVKLLHTNWFLYSDGFVPRYHLKFKRLVQTLCPLFQI
jgi:hypothetical protein